MKINKMNDQNMENDTRELTLEELEQICHNAACLELRQSAKDMLLEKLPIPQLHQFCNELACR